MATFAMCGGVHAQTATVTGFSPTSGPAGTSVRISGTNLGSYSGENVTLNGVSLAIQGGDNSTYIVVTVAGAPTTGPFTVWTASGRVPVTSSGSFTLIGPAPKVSSFSPTTGPPGTPVTITGTNFSTTPSANTVKFNGVAATVTTASATSLAVTVPSGATTGTVSVTVSGQTATSTGTFTVPPTQSAAFVSQSVPTTMVAGQSYPVSVTMTNTGSTTWTAATQYKLGSANGTDWGVGQRVLVPSNVAYGQNVTFSFTVVAPTTTSTATFYWQMLQEGVAWFGATTPAQNISITPAPPVISSFSPSSGAVGTTITISGTGFSATPASNSVTLNGVAAGVTAATTTSLTVAVPTNAVAGPGPIAVTTNGMTATSSANFTVVPAITGFSPTSGLPGSTVRITGTNLGMYNSDSVTLNGNALAIQGGDTTNQTYLLVTAPLVPMTGPFVLTTGLRQSATSSASFSVALPPPTITSFTPTSGPPNTAVTITGTNFVVASGDTVTFNGLTATVSSATSTTLNVLVPSTASTGASTIAVTVGAQSVSSGSPFMVTPPPPPPPTIVSISPTSGPIGSEVIITGTNFSTTANQNQVELNQISEYVIGATNTTLRVQIGAGSATGAIILGVVGRGGAVTGPVFTVAPPPPIVTNVSPSIGAAYDSVTINGINFDPSSTAANTVTFSGASAVVSTATATQLVVTAPNGVTSGPVVVSNTSGSSATISQANVATAGTALASSTYSAAYAPSGAIDGDLTGQLWGNNGGWNDGTPGDFSNDWLEVDFLGPQTINDVVLYTLQDNFAAAVEPTDSMTFTQYGVTSFDVEVLLGSSWSTVASVTGNNLVKRRVAFEAVTTTAMRIVVHDSADHVSSRIVEVEALNEPADFVYGSYLPPVIGSFSPATGLPGTQITITGAYFGLDPFSIGGVYLNGSPLEVVSWSDSTIVVEVPPGSTSGLLTVYAPDRQFASSTTPFTVVQPPITIKDFSPKEGGVVFTTVTITGTGFNPIQGMNTVTFFNGAVASAAAVVVSGTQQITVKVPAGATTGPITVTTGNASAVSSENFKVDPTPALNAQFVSQVPFDDGWRNTAVVSTPISFSINMRNTGTTTWTAGQYFRLGAIGSDGSVWSPGGRIQLPYDVAIGQGVAFNVETTAPATPGVYDFQWQMVQDVPGTRGIWFGDVTPAAAVEILLPIPDAPTSVTAFATPVGSSNVNVTWQPASTGTVATYFEVAYSLHSTGPWTVLNDSLPATPLSTSISLPLGGPYYVGIAACNGPENCSGFTATTSTLTVSSLDTISTTPTSIITAHPSTPPGVTWPPTIPGQDALSDQVGATAGTFGVDQQGNATYSIPVYAPRGAGGLTPSVSLSYNSGSGDGLLGWGWTIGGISSITPCRQTQEHGDGANVQGGFPLDPANGGVYCLDGERMVLVSAAGTNGQVGAQYRLESDNQTLIVVESVLAVTNGTGGNGRGGVHFNVPNVFAVYGKDGTVRRYGGNTAQLSITNGVNWPFTGAWYEYQLVDSNGNAVSFTYTCPLDASGTNIGVCSTDPNTLKSVAAIVPKSIVWSGGEIDFVSTVRPAAQQSISYLIPNIPVTQLYRITEVDVKGPDGSPVRKYTPLLNDSPDNPAVQQVISVQECAGSTCYNPTQFSWVNLGSSITGQNSSSAGAAPFHQTGGESFRFADIDGDGRNDVVWLDTGSGTSGGAYFHVALSKPTATGISLNGDSCPTSNYSCPQASIWLSDPTRGSNLFWQLLDFNGDGKTDLLNLQSLKDSTGKVTSYEWDVWLSNGSAFPNTATNHLTNILVAPNASLSSSPGPMPLLSGVNKGYASTYVADFDGDGLPDLLVVEDTTAEVYLLKPTGVASRPYVYQGPYIVTGPNHPLCGFQGILQGTFQGAIGNTGFHVGDFNGDGRADVVAELSGQPCEVNGSPALPAGSNGSLQVMLSSGIDSTNTYFVFTPTSMSWPLGKLPDCVVGPVHPSCPGVQPLRDSLFQVIDLNGDGLADVVFGGSDSQDGNQASFYYEINQGATFSAPACVVIDTSRGGCISTPHGANQFQVGDYDGDGKGDVWLPLQSTGPGPYPYTIYRYTGSGFDSGTPNSPLNAADISDSPSSVSFQIDLDGDGYPDTFSVDTGTGKWSATRFANHHSPRNMINQITSGLGASTSIAYSPMTYSSVYDREYTGSTLLSGWGAPVQDLSTARFVVQYVDSSAPTTAKPNNTAIVAYHYSGYKVQGFGRGPLGFHTMDTLDEQTGIATVTTYNQAFPLTGTPISTVAYAGSSFGSDPCMSTSTHPTYGPDNAGCMISGTSSPITTGQELNQTSDTWSWHVLGTAGFTSPSLPSPGAPILVERTASQSLKYEINDGTLIAASTVSMTYDSLSGGESYGNLMSSVTNEYGPTSTWDNSQLLRQTTLTNHYTNVITYPSSANNYDATWHLSRLIASWTTVTPWVSGAADSTHAITRNSEFAYDAVTGQLTDEHLQPMSHLDSTDTAPLGTADQALDKYHSYDTYGNENETVTCSASAGCSSAAPALTAAAMTFNPTDPLFVQRYSRSSYSALAAAGTSSLFTGVVIPAGIYANATYAPFSAGGSNAIEQQTSTVVARDSFGNVTDSLDVHGVETLSVYGTMGRPFFSATSTGASSTTVYRWCSVVQCPSNAVYRVDTTLNTGAESWTYFDVLARQVLTVQRGFGETDFYAVTKDYDGLGRVVNVSEPYLTTSPETTAPGLSTTQCGTSPLYCTTTAYDVLGRVTQLTHPNSTSSNLSQTRTQYQGLTSTTTLPANGSGLSETKTMTRNMLGQLVAVTDSLGSVLTNAYDASGNPISTTRTPADGHAAAMSAMTYDVLGRKTQLSDPDLGVWHYSYNAIGEQIQQSSTTTCASNQYDGQGRLISKKDYATAACSGAVDSQATWSYDTGSYDTAASTSCSNTANVGLGSIAQVSGTDNNLSTTRTPQYDCYGRASRTTTVIGTQTFTQRGSYDNYGRPFQNFFQGAGQPETGEVYLYNERGYTYQTRDASNYESGQTYRTVLAMDPRGNVTQEERAGNSNLTILRQYDPAMGWLMSINTGALQSLSYTYDKLGNQLTRIDSSAGVGPVAVAAVNETFGYDALQRLTQQNSATVWSYDSFGNATTGGAAYGGAPPATCLVNNAGSAGGITTGAPGPDAINHDSNNQYCYDTHGNQTAVLSTFGSLLQTSTYTADDKLRSVQSANTGTLIAWNYGPERTRIARSDFVSGHGTPLMTYYVGDAEIIGVGTSTPTIKRYLAGLILNENGGATQAQYLFTDNLGSTHRITDGTGMPFSNGGAQRFGPFGQRTDTSGDGNLAAGDAEAFDTSLTHHGFTGQEQMDEAGLVHMNARVYSPLTMRFTSPDPFVQDATDLQALNRYTYVLNNPLVHTDPSGYWGKKEQGYLREAVGIAIAVYTGNAYSGSWQVGGVTSGTAAAGAQETAAIISSGYLSGFVSSGNLNGAVIGALSAGVNYEIGGIKNPYGNVAAHATAGGVLEVLQGGKFGHGFVSAGLSSAINPNIDLGNAFVNGIAASISGGTISEVTGGKFANGAMSGAFEFAFNYLCHNYPNYDEGATTRTYAFDGAGPANGSDNEEFHDLAEKFGATTIYPGSAMSGDGNAKAALSDAKNFMSQHSDGKIYIFGYSAGADDAINFANLLGKESIPVAGMVTFDPHRKSWFGYKDYSLTGGNVERALNIYQRNEHDVRYNTFRGSPVRGAENMDMTGQDVGHSSIVTQGYSAYAKQINSVMGH